MTEPRIALIAREPETREALAAAFDGAPASWKVSFHDEPPDADVIVTTPGQGTDGAVIFDPDDPGGVVDEVAARLTLARSARVYLVTSGDGGTGVTSVALHLSASLSAFAPTCFLELTTRSSAAFRLGIFHAGHKTWSDGGTTDGDLRLAALPVRGGFRALLSPGDVEPPGDLLDRAAGVFDRVVVDTSPTDLTGVAGSASAAVLLVRPTVPGVQRAMRFLAEAPPLPWAIVLNRCGPGGGLTRAEAARRMGRTIPLELPCTPALRDAEDEGRVLGGSWTRFARRIAALSAALERA